MRNQFRRSRNIFVDREIFWSVEIFFASLECFCHFVLSYLWFLPALIPALTFTLKLLVYMFIYKFLFSFYDDRFAQVYAHYVVQSLSNYFAYHERRAQTSQKVARLAIKQTSNMSLK